MMESFVRRLLPAVLFTLGSVIATPPVLWAQDNSTHEDRTGRWINGVSEPWWFPKAAAKADIKAVQDKWDEINQENTVSTQSEWTGSYFSGGDTHGTYVRWSLVHGFVKLHIDKCAATVMAFSYGKVVANKTQILFVPEKSFSPKGHNHNAHGVVPSKHLPVKWRGVPYLIEENEIRDFCDYLAGLGNFNRGRSGYWLESLPFLKKAYSKETGTAADPPELPRAYKRFIRRSIDAGLMEIGGRIIRRSHTWSGDGPQYESVTRVRIDAGALDGVKARMSFFIIESPADELLIRRVGPHSSWGEVIRMLDDLPGVQPAAWKDAAGMEYWRLARGGRVTTSFHKQILESASESQ